METLVKQLRTTQVDLRKVGDASRIGGLLGDAASRIEDLEDHVARLEDRLATAASDIKGLKGRPHRDG